MRTVIVCVAVICVDVSLATTRMLLAIRGQRVLVPIIGFFEVMIWIVAVSQVIVRLHESWWLALAWAGGFATGNAVGIMVERRIALGEEYYVPSTIGDPAILPEIDILCLVHLNALSRRFPISSSRSLCSP